MLLPFGSSRWWRVYGQSIGQSLGAMDATEPPPRAYDTGFSPRPRSRKDRAVNSQWKQPGTDFHAANARKAMWHELRPAEQRASHAVAALAHSGAFTARARVHMREHGGEPPAATHGGQYGMRAEERLETAPAPGALPPLPGVDDGRSVPLMRSGPTHGRSPREPRVRVN